MSDQSQGNTVNRLAAMELLMTIAPGGVVPGAKRVFDEMYMYYGFPGIEALYNAEYKTPEQLWDFYQKHRQSVSGMAEELGLK